MDNGIWCVTILIGLLAPAIGLTNQQARFPCQGNLSPVWSTLHIQCNGIINASQIINEPRLALYSSTYQNDSFVVMLLKDNPIGNLFTVYWLLFNVTVMQDTLLTMRSVHVIPYAWPHDEGDYRIVLFNSSRTIRDFSQSSVPVNQDRNNFDPSVWLANNYFTSMRPLAVTSFHVTNRSAPVMPPPVIYPVNQPGYPVQQPGHPVPQPGYPVQQPGHPVPQPGYPMQQPGHPQPGYPIQNQPAIHHQSPPVMIAAVQPGPYAYKINGSIYIKHINGSNLPLNYLVIDHVAYVPKFQPINNLTSVLKINGTKYYTYGHGKHSHLINNTLYITSGSSQVILCLTAFVSAILVSLFSASNN